MPELPEVETVVRGLRELLPGRRILEVWMGKTDFIEEPENLARELPGSFIESVQRHGKFTVLALSRNGESAAPRHLLVHLGMTGQLTLRKPEEPAAPHTHVIFRLDDGRELRYTDLRRFGRMRLSAGALENSPLATLGAEPLEISLEEFLARVRTRKSRIKALLLDQHVLRGMGNIYTDESLWRARIHPMRLGCSLRRGEIQRLRAAMRSVLRAAIRLRGSSISDYVDAAGDRGEFQLRHHVYGREGEKCHRCGARVRRAVVAGRGTHFCPRCQRAPRINKRAGNGADSRRKRSRRSR